MIFEIFFAFFIANCNIWSENTLCHLQKSSENSIFSTDSKRVIHPGKHLFMRCKFCGHTMPEDSIPENCPGCGAGFRKNFSIRTPGEMIGKYRVLRLLGRGGSGAVYLCDHPELMTKCAVKMLNDAKSSGDPHFVERLLREAKIASALQRPDVVAVLDAGIEPEKGEPFIVMEYVDGESLEEVLHDGPLPENAVLGIAMRVAAILADAGAKGIVHRDIKPGNILLTSDGNIKLADLGIAKAGLLTGDTISGKDILLGTPNYAAPEQLRNSENVDCRSDIYSLGATMYHMLSGNRPFEADTVFNTIAKVLETELPILQSDENPVSSRTALLVRKMMHKNPGNRPQSIHELRKQLNRCMETKSVFKEKLHNFFIRTSPPAIRKRNRLKRVKIMTPAKIIRDIFLSSAVLTCLIFTWFNFGHAYSEKRRKEHISNLENIRRNEVKKMLTECNPQKLSAFLTNPDTSSRSRREVFSNLLRRSDKLELLLSLIASDVFSARPGEDMLSRACVYPHTDSAVVEELIRAGAVIDYRDKRGRTPLMKALLSGNSGAVKLLLNYGADPSLIDNEGRNALFYLPEKFTKEQLENILATDVQANVRDKTGRTPLMVFVDRFDSPDMLALMISKRFNINRRAHNSESALDIAIKRGHLKSAELLFHSGARFDEKTVRMISGEYRLKKWMSEKLKRKK